MGRIATTPRAIASPASFQVRFWNSIIVGEQPVRAPLRGRPSLPMIFFGRKRGAHGGTPVQVLLLVPSHSLAERCDMCDVMPTVPGVETSILRQSYKSELRMPKHSLEISRLERFQQSHPSLVKRFKQSKRYFDRRRSRVFELSPAVFVIALDGRLIFGQCKLEAAVAVQVAVGHVMRDLSNSPPARSIRRVELFRYQAFNSGSQLRGRLTDCIDRNPNLFIARRVLKIERSYRITKIHRSFSG